MPKSILIVDDTPEIVLALTARLEAHGYQVHCAVTGRAGIESASANQPDVIILDICMPDISGYDVCTQIRSVPELRDVPIIFLSANSQRPFRERASEVGGNYFVPKPYDSARILDAIGSLVAA